MRYISIQKKPTFYSELLMVFINNSYKLYELYQYKAPMVHLFLQRYKIIFKKTNSLGVFFYKLIDKNKLYVCKYC